MSSGVILNGEEYIEEFESLVGLLKETVEKLKRNRLITSEILAEFMPEYINIEEQIIKLLQMPPRKLNYDHMEELIAESTTYLKDYQDTWEDNYWEFYNHWYSKIFDVRPPPHAKGQIENDFSMDEQEMLELSLDLKGRKSNGLNPPGSKLRGSTHDESMNVTTTNINKIDEELREVKEIDFKKTPKEEKKRDCLDNCLIF